jgi:hypothetical protein
MKPLPAVEPKHDGRRSHDPSTAGPVNVLPVAHPNVFISVPHIRVGDVSNVSGRRRRCGWRRSGGCFHRRRWRRCLSIGSIAGRGLLLRRIGRRRLRWHIYHSALNATRKGSQKACGRDFYNDIHFFFILNPLTHDAFHYSIQQNGKRAEVPARKAKPRRDQRSMGSVGGLD